MPALPQLSKQKGYLMHDEEFLEYFLHRVREILFPGHADKNIKFNTKNHEGETPLHIAALWGDRRAVNILLEKGSDIDAKGDMGCTPLYYAIMNNHKECAFLLLDAGANPNILTELNYTPTDLAKNLKRKEIAHKIRTRR
jgi:ankyrin repeat protein